jgi:hypothetical protein
MPRGQNHGSDELLARFGWSSTSQREPNLEKQNPTFNIGKVVLSLLSQFLINGLTFLVFSVTLDYDYILVMISCLMRPCVEHAALMMWGLTVFCLHHGDEPFLPSLYYFSDLVRTQPASTVATAYLLYNSVLGLHPRYVNDDSTI